MDKRITLVGIVAIIVVGLAILINIIFIKPANFRGTVYAEPYPIATEFNLGNTSGNSIKLSDYHGRIVLLFFGYTYCPDVCPTTLAELKLVMNELGQESNNVQVIFISVDPKRDTSESLQKYVERFSPAFIGLSGTTEELSPIWKGYGIFREEVAGTSDTNYIVNHTARVYLIDQNGNMRLSYGFQSPTDDIVNDIEILLRQ